MTFRDRLRGASIAFQMARTGRAQVVLARKNLPAQFPIAATAIAWLFYEVYRPPFWVWVPAAILLAIWWLGVLVLIMATQIQADIFASVNNKEVRRDIWKRATDREPAAGDGAGSVGPESGGPGPLQSEPPQQP